ncbi:MAG: sugar phosphate isomerase/epimerase family protein [Acidobacteriota bacterium]
MKSSIKPSRRDFIAVTTTAAIAVSGAGATTVSAKSPEKEDKTPRKFELGTVTYNLAKDWDIDTLISNCEETGFKAVELRTTHKHGVEIGLSKAEREAVRKRFAETQVKLVCLGTTCEFHSPDQAVVRERIKEAKEFIKLAADVGSIAIKVRPNGVPEDVPKEKTFEQIGTSLREIGLFAREHDVEIWMEVHGRDSSHPPYIAEMMKHCGHPSVGLTWNCNDSDLKDGDVVPYFNLLKDHIRNVHMRDLTVGYPYKQVFGLLRGIGYSGYTLSEIPEVKGDPIRFMKYYRMLWEELSGSAV